MLQLQSSLVSSIRPQWQNFHSMTCSTPPQLFGNVLALINKGKVSRRERNKSISSQLTISFTVYFSIIFLLTQNRPVSQVSQVVIFFDIFSNIALYPSLTILLTISQYNLYWMISSMSKLTSHFQWSGSQHRYHYFIC